MAEERRANCKECGEVYSYSVGWGAALAEEGRSPTEYCPRCRAIHSLERASIAMPYFQARPTRLRQPDQELRPGRLGRLTHQPREHRTVAIEAKFHKPGSGIRFGIEDPDIVELIKTMLVHQVTVVVGPTGSGKSTFLPYRLMVPPPPYAEDLFTRHGQIIVTEPRQQATRRPPKFVAEDLHGCSLGAGGDVGYVHRGEFAADRHAKLVYCTDGTLINWIAGGRMGEFSIIMIDEAHERNLNIDVILGLLRMRLPLYPNLKLVIASATINAKLFMEHFSPLGPVGFVEFKGHSPFDYQREFRSKPVTKSPKPELMVPAVVDEVTQVLCAIAGTGDLLKSPQQVKGDPSPSLRAWSEGDILAFLPTVSTIDEAAALTRMRIKDNPVLSARGIEVHTLHRQLPIDVQDLALQTKAKAITGKVMKVLQQMASAGVPSGAILALLLDDKSVADAVTQLSEAIGEVAALAGTVVSTFPETAEAASQRDGPRKVVVGTFESVPEAARDGFSIVICDRRVVIATNVAETSLTVDGIVYVVDSGLILRDYWDTATLSQSFRTDWHSQDGCKQRWGRAGRVRNGWVRCTYTQQQFEEFEAHTAPDIQRAPLEAVVLTAKGAGVDDVASFPWIQPPEAGELTRAVETLTARGLLDADGDLTDQGQVVARFGERPDTGLLMALADQYACAVEMATLVCMMNLRLHGGLLRWHHQWDGHTRRGVRRIHDALKTGCQDDFEFRLKVYQAWSEAWLPDYNWLTDEVFELTWPDKAPPLSAEQTKELGDAATGFVAEAKSTRNEESLEKLAREHLSGLQADAWLREAKTAMRDARRAAWATRFFVNHAMLVKADAQREEMLARLSIGKKSAESRPVNFDILVPRAKLVMAYAWPDQVYVRQGREYRPHKASTAEREKNFVVDIDRDSILAGQQQLLPAFVCGRRSAGSRHQGQGAPQPAIRVGLLAALDPQWLSAISLSRMELAQWISTNLNEGVGRDQVAISARIFIDQDNPLGATCACRPVYPAKNGQVFAQIVDPVTAPPVLQEATPEGEILWMEEVADSNESDVDPRAGRDADVKARLDPEAEDPLAGHEIDEEATPPAAIPPRARLPMRQVAGILSLDSSQVSEEVIQAEVSGYELSPSQPARVRLSSQPSPDAVRGFQTEYPIGSPVQVVPVELEEAPSGEQVSLVCKVEGVEVVMEATDLTFAGRYAMLRRVRLHEPFQAVFESVDLDRRRVYLSCLPLLEGYLPGPDAVVDAVVTEVVEGGLHVALEPAPADLPAEPTLFCANIDVPESLRQTGLGERVRVRLLPAKEHSKRLASLEPALTTLLQDPYWRGHVTWDADAHKIVVSARLTNTERLELLALALDPRLRRAINELYRLSNTVQGRIDMSETLSAYAQHVQPDAIIPATILRVWKQEVLLSVADGVRAKVPLAELNQAGLGRIQEDEVIDVFVKSVSTSKGYAEVRPANPAESKLRRYSLGKTYTGRVTRIESYGLFVRLDAGDAGLTQAWETSWSSWNKVVQLEQLFDIGDPVKVRILRIRPDGKIDLTLRIDENRPEALYEIGSRVQARVIQLAPFGAFARLGPGQLGLIQVAEMAWYGRPIPAQVVTPGQTVSVRVLKIAGDPPEIKLSTKAAFRVEVDLSSEQSAPSQQQREVIKQLEMEMDIAVRFAPGAMIVLASGSRKIDDTLARIQSLLGISTSHRRSD